MHNLDSAEMRKAMDAMRPNPNPRLVGLITYAIDEIVPKLYRKEEYSEWLAWAASWKAGRCAPQNCVDVAHICFRQAKENDLSMGHTLGQIAWGAKEACYSSPQNGWYVMCYIADAMIAFGVACPVEAFSALEPPTIDADAVEGRPALMDSSI